MTCASCGTGNEAGRKFCKECGSPLALACPACGVANPPDAKFCGECAARLTAPVASGTTPAAGATSAAAPVAERRVVSVLFVDLVGYTTLSEGMDAEDARELLTRYIDLARDIVGRYGGTIEKSIGDAVMAVWGAPVAHEDDAERAVRAALQLVDRVPSLAAGLAARGGVLTGEAAVTLGAEGQGMVAGDLVNTTARLQSVAPTGSVLVGATTQVAAGRGIVFEPAGEQVLKGKAAPVPAWRAIRVADEQVVDALEPPFVGRDDELRLLADLLAATIRERRARLVSLYGPAGIGKSRLAQEFVRSLAGLPEPVASHSGRSPNYGEGVSFWAVGEMVRSRCGLVEGDDELTTRARLAATLDTLVDDPAERRWIETALLVLLGVEREVGPEQLFAAWRTFFERIAASAPVVLVFEDLQFADSGVVAFIDHVLEWSRGVPLFVLTLARPELLEAHPAFGNARRSFTSLFLDPLPPEAMRGLLDGLVPGLPEAAVRAIVDRADGVPLYAVETVRTLLADGRLELVDGTYLPTGDLAGLAIPETLTALIASRLDALDAPDRALISAAAVLGQSFSLGVLAAVAGVDEAHLEPSLQSLVRRELLRFDADPRSPEQGQYQFVQGLIRETAYNTLAKRDRVQRHLAAARHLESLGSDELAGALAGHYLAARANAPAGPEADALATQARVTLRAAADRAAALASHAQALAFLELALTVATDATVRADLLEQAGREARSAGDRVRGTALLEEAIELHRAAGAREAQCRATTELARLLLPAQIEVGAALVDAAIEEFADLAGTPVGIALRTQEARARYLQHRNGEAVAVADAVLPLAETAGLVPEIADLLVTRGSALCNAGRPREGVGAIEAGRRLAEAFDLPYVIIRAANNASAYVAQEQPEAALDSLVGGLQLAARLGLVAETYSFTEFAAFVAYGLGRWDRGVQLLGDSLAMLDDSVRVHMVEWLATYEILRGEAPGPRVELVRDLLVGETDPATLAHGVALDAFIALVTGDRGMAEAALAWADANEPDGANVVDLAIVARLAAWDDDADVVATVLERMRRQEPAGRTLAATVSTIEASLHALAGRVPEAKEQYTAAIRSLSDLGLRWDAALVGLDMATVLDPADPVVAAAAGVARTTMVELGAFPFIERLDAALARDRRPEARPAADPVRP